MFFMNHQHMECVVQDGRNYMNLHEASFIVGLCKYLIQQGYTASQVTVVTMYTAQVTKIEESMRTDPMLRQIHVKTVDDFYGEENDIILVSFVRSTVDKSIDFMMAPNRVNVALSSARKGLYCIGNFKMMAEQSKRDAKKHFPWNELVESLKKRSAIGVALAVRCHNHGTTCLVKTKADFLENAPEGGCASVCDTSFRCGHVCKRVCHILNKDSEHDQMQQNCNENCDELCVIRGHRCPKIKCHYPAPCGKCTAIVAEILMKCQHTVPVFCSSDLSSIRCKNPCERNRSCGHKCTGTCSEICDEIICVENVWVKSPCGHTVIVKCSDAANELKLLKACAEPCNVELKCAKKHRCSEKCHYPKKCGKCIFEMEKGRTDCHHICYVPCWMNPSQIVCSHPCERSRSCGHKCTGICAAICDEIICCENVEVKSPCGHTVIVKCSDATNDLKLTETCTATCNIACAEGHCCQDKCHYPKKCGKCWIEVEKLRPECQHTSLVPCWMSPSQIVCSHPCERNRTCGHRCKGVCSAICNTLICNENVETKTCCGCRIFRTCSVAAKKLKLHYTYCTETDLRPVSGDAVKEVKKCEHVRDIKKKKNNKHDGGIADLEHITDYVKEEELPAGDRSDAIKMFNDMRNKETTEKLAKEQELRKIHMKDVDIELIMNEMLITRRQAENALRENGGDVVATLMALIN